MKPRSGHIAFPKKIKFKDLIPAFRELLTKFLNETGQAPEEKEILNLLIEENVRELKMNRKPEGYNRQGANTRLIFPISDRVEFYVYGGAKSLEVMRITELLSRILNKKKLKHSVEWDKLIMFKKVK
ncbi:MAG: hypothetical protein KAI64_06455 [Thermoplasmata archaeon]|nr:hypothetical protein [Thermoplasmata archaeon]